MKKSALLATFLMLSTTGCPPEKEQGSAEGARDAIPGAEELKVEVPAGTAKPTDPRVGDVATFYVATLATATVLNGGAAFVLILVRTIVSFPVTSVEGDTFIWGPWTESGLKPGEYRLTARMNDDGDYEWRFQGRKKADGAAAAFKDVVSGLATPGSTPHRGTGSFTMDFDTARAIDPLSDPSAQGQLSVTYDLERVPVTIAMDAERLAPTQGGGSALATFHYEYSQAADGSGELSFMSFGDTDDAGAGWEMSQVHSRWKQNGAGRADVMVSGGDLGSTTVSATECWSSAYLRTYYTDSVAWIPTEGLASTCAF